MDKTADGRILITERTTGNLRVVAAGRAASCAAVHDRRHLHRRSGTPGRRRAPAVRCERVGLSLLHGRDQREQQGHALHRHGVRLRERIRHRREPRRGPVLPEKRRRPRVRIRRQALHRRAATWRRRATARTTPRCSARSSASTTMAAFPRTIQRPGAWSTPRAFATHGPRRERRRATSTRSTSAPASRSTTRSTGSAREGTTAGI